MPTVGVQMHVFARLAESAARVSGVARPRQAFVPGTVVDKSPAELRAYIEGDDAISGRPFMQEVIEALTRPLAPEDLDGLTFDRSTPRLLEPDTEENLRRLFEENWWTDFLPIVLPTEERVEAMLAGTSRAPDEVVGRLRPTMYREWWEFTVEQVAVNAVMVGARPEYLPVILALAASGVTARVSSVTSIANMVVVNGPIRNEIAMNYRTGAMGPYNHANATIGRAYGLLSQNLQGGSVPGETYVGSLGNNFAYNNVTFAENEEDSPWEPLHTRYGFGPEDSAVSVFYPVWNMIRTFGLRKTWREKILDILSAQDPHGGLVLILDPSAARELATRAGITGRDELIDWIHNSATMRAEKWWDHFTVEMFVKPHADAGVEPWASLAKAAPDELVPIWQHDRINVVVTGSETNVAIAAASGRHQSTMSIDDWR